MPGTSEELEPIFNPASIAIVGASSQPEKLGHRILKNLLRMGFAGKVYPVNPDQKEILGLSVFPSLVDIPGPVDLAVIVVRSSTALEVLKQCVRKKVKGAVVISAGFSEAGSSQLQRDLVETASKGNVRIVGPNCEGILNSTVGLDLTFAAKTPQTVGGISFISQSGAIGANTMFRWAYERGIGFSLFVSSGNEADLSASDYLEYFGQDPKTRVIMVYLEGVKKGREFLDVARRVGCTKPIVLLKGGESEAGARAVLSHTGVLAGSDLIVKAACRQAGIILVEDIDELLDFAFTLETQPIPKGNRVGLVTGAGGGMGVIATDACIKLGLEVPAYSSKTRGRLRSLPPEVLPSYASVNNPIDLTPGSGSYNSLRVLEVAEIALQDENTDSLLLMGFNHRPESVSTEATLAERIVDLKRYGKPILVVSVSSKYEYHETLKKLEAGGIPVFLTPKRATKALAAMIEYKKYLQRKIGTHSFS
jgi:acetyl coenzyme A synthetase (ADP forming)-like protein